MIDINHLTLSFDQEPVLKGLDLHFKKGEIIALVGASGSGKSTLLNLMSGRIQPSSGSIRIFGKDPLEATDFVTLMQHDDALLPWRDVMSNITLFSELGEKKAIDPDKAYSLLETLGLKDKAHTFPSELSKGMRQRASLARVFLENRPLILLDEPFSSLDVVLREHLYHLIDQLHQQLDKTILFVTHDFHDAFALADRIVVLRDGKIVKEYTVDKELKDDPLYVQNLKESIKLTLC